MKAKNVLALLLAVFLILALSACGGSTSTGRQTREEEESSSASTSGDEEGPKNDDPSNKYGLDYESEEWQDMSDERLPEADLLTAYEQVKEIVAGSMTYEEMAALIGVDASCFRFDGTSRIYEWQTEESSASYIRVLFKEENGEWLNDFYSKTNM